jgi:hypothetical protein
MTRVAKIRIVIEYDTIQTDTSMKNISVGEEEKVIPISDYKKMILEADLHGENTMISLGKTKNMTINYE